MSGTFSSGRKSGKSGIIKYTIFVVSMSLGILIFLGTPSYVFNVIAKEGIKIENAFGAKTLNFIDKKTREQYEAAFIDSGIYATAWHWVIPTKQEQKPTVADKVLTGILLWGQDRINLIFILLFLLIHRLELILMLIPSASFILGASALTGVYIRKIKQGNFAFASPTVHRYSIGVLTIFFSTLPFILLIPVVISPFIFAFSFIVISFLIQITIANIAKRV